jgi:DNA-binding SARP family transcriptional activator
MSSQRVIAFLALHRRPLRRVYVAGSLWPETSDGRAAASLRSALWRIKRPSGLIEASGEQLRLHPAVQVDVFEVEALARRELRGEVDDEVEVDPYMFVADLLPDWYDDWLLIERERFRQLRLCALDALCERFTRASRFSSALEAGLLSVAGEPLRESAHSALVRAHLTQGNLGEALRQYRLCRRLFLERLGVEPTERLTELVASRLGLDAVGQGRDAA